MTMQWRSPCAARRRTERRDIQELTEEFHREHPEITVRYVTLPENEARARITQDVATKAGQFDVVMIGTYEAPIWGPTTASPT